MRNPLISVLMPSYNHANYITEAVRSVLDQSYTNIQLVIVDDASDDDTIQVLRTINDDRIVVQALSLNVGACEAMNIGISLCMGDYIAVCNSDDIWAPDKLAQQIKVLAGMKSVGAVFTDVDWIDGQGQPLQSLLNYEHVFRQPNRSRYEWIRNLTENGNCLCHPSVLIRRDVYAKVGVYNNYYRQLPDLDMWIRLLEQYEIFILPEKLVKFRLHDNNTSRPSWTVSNRDLNERRIILSQLMARISSDTFFKTFGFSDVPTSLEPLDFQIEKVHYLFSYSGVYRSIFHQLACETFAQLPENLTLQSKISPHTFHKEMGRHSPWLAPFAENLAVPSADVAQNVAERIELPPVVPAHFEHVPNWGGGVDSVEETKTLALAKIIFHRLKTRLLSKRYQY